LHGSISGLFYHLFTPAEQLCTLALPAIMQNSQGCSLLQLIPHPGFEYDFHSNGILLIFPFHTLLLFLLYPLLLSSSSHPMPLSSVGAREKK